MKIDENTRMGILKSVSSWVLPSLDDPQHLGGPYFNIDVFWLYLNSDYDWQFGE